MARPKGQGKQTKELITEKAKFRYLACNARKTDFLAALYIIEEV